MAKITYIDIGNTVYELHDGNALPASMKGAAGGIAELDVNGKILFSQLPSYVDDVLEFSSILSFPETGESGIIYVATDTNITYRWSGTEYVSIGSDLALGETSSTAYRGDRGAAAYTHAVTNKGNAFINGLYKITTNSEGHVIAATAVGKTDITDLGIPAQDTTYTSKSAVSEGTEDSLVTTGEKAIWNSKPDTKTITITLPSSGWSNKSQTITANGVTANNIVVISPVLNNMDDYLKYRIICTTQGANSLTFTCDIVPTSAISLDILIID